MYLVNFVLRKIERRTELFVDAEGYAGEVFPENEKDYD
jgi:hypothetical protein